MPIELKDSCARVPVSDEELVELLVKGQENGNVEFRDIEREFHEQYYPLICYFVQRTNIDLGNETDDVIQECYLSVRKKLPRYDAKRAKLSTYIGSICRSAIYTYWSRKMSKRLAHFVELDDEMDIKDGKVNPPNYLAEMIRKTICDLFDDYPENKEMLAEMFGGDPREKDKYRLPERISCAEIARNLDVKYNDVHNFYRKIVTPYFKERFK